MILVWFGLCFVNVVVVVVDGLVLALTWVDELNWLGPFTFWLFFLVAMRSIMIVLGTTTGHE